MKGFNRKSFRACIAIALALCMAQIRGSTILILGCLAVFIAFLGYGCSKNHTLPVLLFFLPWAPLLRTSPDNISFYTIGLVLVCIISAVKNWFRFRRYHIVAGILLALLTLAAKIIDGNGLAMDYICFMMLIVLFPVVREESSTETYDFYEAVVYFSAGVAIASLCAQWFAAYPNIARYVDVYSYQTIVRRCGFYGDPNFYTAQITAALSGCLVLILKGDNAKRTAFLAFMILILLYCGFLSGSKSFVLVFATMAFLWAVELLRMRGRFGLKMILIAFGILAVMYIASSSLFGGLIRVVQTRFSRANDVDSFTTGRTELWKSYYNAIMGDVKTLLIGRGFTNVKVNFRASHNTILQMIFQFGLLGTPVLLGWIVCLFRGMVGMEHSGKGQALKICIVFLGIYLPWMALDILFFDEFFLLQWFCYIGMREICMPEKDNGIADAPDEAYA